MIFRRILWTVILIVLFLTTPWWIFIIGGIAGIILFPWYLEFIFISLFVDLLFSSSMFSIEYMYTLIAFVSFLVSYFIRKQIFIESRF